MFGLFQNASLSLIISNLINSKFKTDSFYEAFWDIFLYHYICYRLFSANHEFAHDDLSATDSSASAVGWSSADMIILAAWHDPRLCRYWLCHITFISELFILHTCCLVESALFQVQPGI